MEKCKLDGCNSPRHCKGFCSLHYTRMHRHGDPNKVLCIHNANYKKYPSEYKAWVRMKERCSNPNDKKYHLYGGKGISVCERWTDKLNGFNNFLSDIGPKPGVGYSIDRINPDLGYIKSNCRWANIWEQNSHLSGRPNRRVGVFRNNTKKDTSKHWTARIKVQGKVYYKNFFTEEEALEQRKEWERTFVGFEL